MPTSLPVLLIDTNVWLDCFLPDRDRDGVSHRLLVEAQERGVTLVFPAHAALDVYQTVRIANKRWVLASHEMDDRWAAAIKRLAWDCVDEMCERATPVPADASDYYLARKFRDLHDDLEDDLVLAACRRAKANYLVTNDKKLLGHAPVDARTPAQMTDLLIAGLAVGSFVDKDTAEDTQWLYRWLSNPAAKEDV